MPGSCLAWPLSDCAAITVALALSPAEQAARLQPDRSSDPDEREARDSASLLFTVPVLSQGLANRSEELDKCSLIFKKILSGKYLKVLEVTRNHALPPVSALPQGPISGDTFNIVPGSHLWFLGLKNVIVPRKGHFVSARNHSFPFTAPLSEGIRETRVPKAIWLRRSQSMHPADFREDKHGWVHFSHQWVFQFFP